MMKDARGQLFFLALFRTSRSIAAGMITIAFPYLVLRYRHYSPLQLGLLYTSAAVSTAFLGLLFGFLADVWGRGKTLFLVGLLLPLSSALVFLSSRLPVLFVATSLGGYSATGSLMTGGIGGAAQPIQNAVIADLTTSENRTFYFSILTFLSGLSGAFGALLARHGEVRHIFLWATIISGSGLIFLAFINTANVRGSLRRLHSKIVIGKFTVTGMLNGFTQGLVVPFLIPFFVIVYHVPKSEMAVYAFASGMLAAFALLAAPRLEQGLGFVKSIAVTRGLGTVLLLLLPFCHIYAVALIIYLLTPALRVTAVPVQQTALTEMVNQDELGRALGINQVARLGASSGGITLTGYLFNISDIAMPFCIYAVVMAANILLYFRFFHKSYGRDLNKG
ncbi:MAG TPA: MFS transporter [Terriglobia bacterium]|nr:MFS transporter [Terriglobia bacterium]